MLFHIIAHMSARVVSHVEPNGRVVARKYPTVTLKGMVFVWMGDGEPAPLEEDIPPEFFDDVTMILFHTEYWPVQWNLPRYGRYLSSKSVTPTLPVSLAQPSQALIALCDTLSATEHGTCWLGLLKTGRPSTMPA